MNQTNPSIQCSVSNCTYHANNHCTLNEIKVGCTTPNATSCASTECASFKMGPAIRVPLNTRAGYEHAPIEPGARKGCADREWSGLHRRNHDA